jgi:ATPase subunit of ABC transporter with duplicated ATPase domains
MDEPTNHLDMQTIDGLVEGLRHFQGGILIVSHDQYFITKVCKEIWYIKDRRLRKFRGNFEEYKKSVLVNTLD